METMKTIFPWAAMEALGLIGLVWWFALDGHPAFAAIGAPMALVGVYGVVRGAIKLAQKNSQFNADSE